MHANVGIGLRLAGNRELFWSLTVLIDGSQSGKYGGVAGVTRLEPV